MNAAPRLSEPRCNHAYRTGKLNAHTYATWTFILNLKIKRTSNGNLEMKRKYVSGRNLQLRRIPFGCCSTRILKARIVRKLIDRDFVVRFTSNISRISE